ncbi:universal stress protein [Halalkalicoccus ordinarius]|uniref:universal stress protein n=1 Tax=Halalkalicoccus ordinarius TaxID=3116651 RepID=UPI00300ED655
MALETETVVGRPACSIVEFAEERDVDGIVTGSHGRDGISRISSAAFEDPSGSSSRSKRYALRRRLEELCSSDDVAETVARLVDGSTPA